MLPLLLLQPALGRPLCVRLCVCVRSARALFDSRAQDQVVIVRPLRWPRGGGSGGQSGHWRWPRTLRAGPPAAATLQAQVRRAEIWSRRMESERQSLVREACEACSSRSHRLLLPGRRQAALALVIHMHKVAAKRAQGRPSRRLSCCWQSSWKSCSRPGKHTKPRQDVTLSPSSELPRGRSRNGHDRGQHPAAS